MIPRAQYVGHVVVNGLESGVGYLPLFVVLGLGDVSHVSGHDDIHLLLVLLDPFGLREETGTLITNVGPVLLCFFMSDISVALGVRQNDQGKRIGVSLGFLTCRRPRLFRVISASGFLSLTCRDRCRLPAPGRNCRLDIVGDL